MFSIWWQRCISNQGYRTVLTSIIFQNTIRGLWLHFFLNTKIFNFKHFRFQPSDSLIQPKAHHNVYRLLQPINSNQQLKQWLTSNFVSKKSFKFEFSNPQILGTLPPPPAPRLKTLPSSNSWFHSNRLVCLNNIPHWVLHNISHNVLDKVPKNFDESNR